MKKIFQWFLSFEKDKILHFSLSLVIGLVAACIAKLLGGDKYTILFSTFAASVLVGIAKEIYDESVDWYDMLADFVGVAAACIFSFILVFG